MERLIDSLNVVRGETCGHGLDALPIARSQESLAAVQLERFDPTGVPRRLS